MARAIESKCFEENPAECAVPKFPWKQCGRNETTTQPKGYPFSVPVGRSLLPKSKSNQLLTLMRVSSIDCSSVAAARSYDGHEWEASLPLPLKELHCAGNNCNITIPYGDLACPEIEVPCSYRVDAIDIDPFERLSAEQTLSRFLTQSTFDQLQSRTPPPLLHPPTCPSHPVPGYGPSPSQWAKRGRGTA